MQMKFDLVVQVYLDRQVKDMDLVPRYYHEHFADGSAYTVCLLINEIFQPGVNAITDPEAYEILVLARGVSICSQDDLFSKPYGRQKALKRALGVYNREKVTYYPIYCFGEIRGFNSALTALIKNDIKHKSTFCPSLTDRDKMVASRGGRNKIIYTGEMNA